MIIVMIGRSYSGKRRLARYIRKASNNRFRLFKPFTTRPDYNEARHQYMPQEARDALEPSRIFHSMKTAQGYEYFSLTTQFIKGGNLIYVMDDPASLARIDELGVPYVVAYVDCNTSKILKQIRSFRDIVVTVLGRFSQIRGRLRKMKRSGDFHLYINTSVMSAKDQESTMALFYANAVRWERLRKEGELRPKTLSESYKDIWSLKAKSDGYALTEFREG